MDSDGKVVSYTPEEAAKLQGERDAEEEAFGELLGDEHFEEDLDDVSDLVPTTPISRTPISTPTTSRSRRRRSLARARLTKAPAQTKARRLQVGPEVLRMMTLSRRMSSMRPITRALPTGSLRTAKERGGRHDEAQSMEGAAIHRARVRWPACWQQYRARYGPQGNFCARGGDRLLRPSMKISGYGRRRMLCRRALSDRDG